MAGGYKNIHNHPNAGKNDFRKRPQDAGKKKNNYNTIIEQIESLGYVAPTKSEMFKFLALCFVMTESDLKAFVENKENPHWKRLMIIDMNNKATRQKLMSEYRDWVFGKAEQKIETKTTTGIDPEIKEAILKSLKPLTEDE